MELIDVLAEVVGGALAGRVGAALPDYFEPATSSHHRSTMHSLATTGAVAYGGVVKATALADRLRTLARPQVVAVEGGQVQMAVHPAKRIAARFAAGAAVGLPAGYVSHTVADSITPRGIPLVTRGF